MSYCLHHANITLRFCLIVCPGFGVYKLLYKAIVKAALRSDDVCVHVSGQGIEEDRMNFKFVVLESLKLHIGQYFYLYV